MFNPRRLMPRGWVVGTFLAAVVVAVLSSSAPPEAEAKGKGKSPSKGQSKACLSDASCSDGSFCNGPERCAPGSPGANARGCLPPAFINVCAAPTTCSDVAQRCIERCDEDADCRNALFCDGTERCVPGAPGSDPAGCLAATPATACFADQSCNETTDRCETPCPGGVPADADGDGHRSIACHGDDCDDTDRDRFPGNLERCDDGHDEDCNGETFGRRDLDGDGFADGRCCNRVGAVTRCGSDCDDSNAALGLNSQRCGSKPGTVELCSGGETWRGVSCPASTVCISQPNGTGVCTR